MYATAHWKSPTIFLRQKYGLPHSSNILISACKKPGLCHSRFHSAQRMDWYTSLVIICSQTWLMNSVVEVRVKTTNRDGAVVSLRQFLVYVIVSMLGWNPKNTACTWKWQMSDFDGWQACLFMQADNYLDSDFIVAHLRSHWTNI